MKIKSFLIPALALALAGCANEELETIGSGTIPAVPSGQTILFSNNTALTIGDADGVQTRAMEGSMELRENVNEACNLELEEVPSIPDEVATLSDKQLFRSFGNHGRRICRVPQRNKVRRNAGRDLYGCRTACR